METITSRNCDKQSIAQRLIILVLPLALILGTAGCEGPSGPRGSEGPQGPKGEQGPVGPAGEDGSQIYSGTGAPAASLGVEGDYYLDKSSFELYGPKTSNGWGTSILLKGPQGPAGPQGPQGPAGEDGSQIHSGSGAPAASLGINGDYYLDKSSFELYGPKSNGSWGTPISLKGTANVIYSSWIEFDSSGWTSLQSRFGMDFREYPISAPRIDSDIKNSGVVLGYISFVCCTDVDPLPVVIDNDSKVSFEYVEGEIQVKRHNFPDATGDPGTFGSGNQFRYVIIPGGVAAKSKLSQKQLKEMPYQQVKRRFGIGN